MKKKIKNFEKKNVFYKIIFNNNNFIIKLFNIT